VYLYKQKEFQLAYSNWLCHAFGVIILKVALITYLILLSVTETKLFCAYYVVKFCNYSKDGTDINKRHFY
jgi:hypothetical protein